MAAPKRAAVKKESEPQGPQVEGFKVIDYEGLDMLVCDRCGFDTFDLGSAKSHLGEHKRADDLAELTKETTEHLTETAQVTIEEAPDEG
jgi:hypothetical protein